jgi:insulysin
LQVIVNGYDHKLGLLLDKVIEKLVDFEMSTQRFEVLKDFYVRSLKNWEDKQPYSHAYYYSDYILGEKEYSKQELLSATQGRIMTMT